MRTRKRSKNNRTLLIAGLIVLAGGCAWLAISQLGGASGGALRTVEGLDPDAYYDNSVSLRGNTYRIDAEIDRLLGSAPARGRLFSVVLTGGDGMSRTAHKMLPLLVPVQFNDISIQKGQRYLFKVKVLDNGLLSSSFLTKP